MNIRTKLILVVCALIVAMMAQFWGFHYVFQRSSSAGSSAVLYLNSAHLLAALESNVNGARKELSNFVLTDDVKHLQALPEYVIEAEKVLEGLTQVQALAAQKTDDDSRLVYYESRKIAEEGYTLISQLQGEIGRYTMVGEALNLSALKVGIDWSAYNNELDFLQKKISVATKRVLDKAIGVQEELDSIYKSSLSLAIIILLLALLVAVAASGVIQLHIVGGVQRLCEVLRDLRADGLDLEIAPWSKDEFAQIVTAVNTMSQRLRESTVSKDQLDLILSSMAEGLCVVRSGWRIVTANRSACELLEQDINSLKEQKLSDYLAAPSASESAAYDLFLQKRISGHVEQRLIVPGKADRDVLLAWQKLGRQPDDRELYVVTLSDISERKALQHKLVHSQKIDAIGKLAGGVAHDFNNLLAGIGGSAHILKAHCKSDQFLMEQAEIITQCVQHASDLTRKLLGFSRKAQHGEAHLSMRSVFDQVVGIIEKTLPKDIAIESQIPKGTWNIIGDSSQLASVLINLALNSRDAISGKGVIKFFVGNQVVTSAFDRDGLLHELQDGSYVRISVQDNGRGVPEAIKSQIFEPFFTTKQLGSGTGLGLSMVSEIVKNHKGSLRISSQMGLGTCVDIFLPADTTSTEELEFDHLSMKGTEHRDFSALLGKRVMLVDDEPLVRTVTRKFLEQHGCEVVTAENGEIAIELFDADNDRFDAVILDVIMPRKDGIETFNELRSKSPHLPIIFYSGYAEAEQLEKAGVDAEKNFISKPYLPEEFLETLSRAVSAGTEQSDRTDPE